MIGGSIHGREAHKRWKDRQNKHRMSVEANQSWTPQYGDVGQNKNLGADTESTESRPLSKAGKAAENQTAAASTNLSGGVESRHAVTHRAPCAPPAQLSYKGELTRAMDELAKDPLIRFVGYGVQIGRAMGTLKNVPYSQLIEMPVAENLMVSFAIGLSLKGLKPIVFIERFDFILNALDAIVNHLDKIGDMSHGEFNPTMIFRIVVGNRNKPLFTGKTHTQDFSPALRSLVSFPVVGLSDAKQIVVGYKAAHAFMDRRSTALVEYKDLL